MPNSKIDHNSPEYKKAAKRVKDIKDFYEHLQAYIFVNLILLIINLVTYSEFLWVAYTAVFWGIGILFHAAGVYIFDGRFFGADWEEKKIQEILDKQSK